MTSSTNIDWDYRQGKRCYKAGRTANAKVLREPIATVFCSLISRVRTRYEAFYLCQTWHDAFPNTTIKKIMTNMPPETVASSITHGMKETHVMEEV